MANQQNSLTGSQGTGTNNADFAFTFPSFTTSEVKVEVDNVVKTLTTHYTVEEYNANTGGKVRFTTNNIPTGTTPVRIFRQTDVDNPKATFEAGSSLKAAEINDNFKQVRHALQEAIGVNTNDRKIQPFNIEDSSITSDKIKDDTIVNADVNASAAIAGTKVSPDFGSQNIATTGTINNLTTTELAILDGATVTTTELNKLDGVTASTAELNILDGVTSTATELNILDGVTASTTEINKLDGVTATTTELNLVDGVTATTAELNYVDGVTSNVQTQLDGKQPLDAELTELATMSSGTASALADLTQTEVQVLDGVTASTTELNYVDGVTSAIQTQLDAKQPLDAELTELATMPSTTASALADLTQAEVQTLDGVTATTTELNLLDGVTATTTELNLNDGQTATPTEVNILDGATLNTNELNILDGVTASTSELNLLDGKSIVTSIAGNATDVQIPSAQAVNERVVELVTEVGGFHPIANETSFPTTNPDINDGAGTIVSIKALSNAFTLGSGVTTKVFTNGAGSGNDVTVNGLTASTTYPAGRGMLLETTTTLHTYNYHRLTLDEAGVANAQAVVDDFDERYYGPFSANQATRPSGANRVNGDLYFNTSDGKMKVWNGSHASGSWDDVAAPGNFFINTLSSSSGSGGGQSAFNGGATRFTLSNPPNSAQQLLVSVNGVVQKPNSGTSPSEGFAIDGADIIFASAPATSAPFFIVTIGSSVNIGTPSDNTVTSAKIVNGSIINEDISSSAAIAGTKISPTFTSNVTVSNTEPTLFLTDTDSNSDFAIKNHNGTFDIRDTTNGSDRLRIASDGTISSLANHDFSAGIDVTGNITVSGTVDGIDIATDVAANTAKVTNATHTGEVTGATALTIADNVVDEANLKVSNSPTNGYFLSAQSGNTGGLTWAAVTSDLVDDSSPQLGGDLASNGNDINFADGDKVIFGTDSDLQIYHESNNSWIKELGSGSMNINTNRLNVANAADNEVLINAQQDGAVDLYYDGVKTFSTISNGVKVEGTEGAAGLLELYADEGDDNGDKWRFVAETNGILNLQDYGAGSWYNNIRFTGNTGGVILFQNNDAKFQTQSDGVRVEDAGYLYLQNDSENAASSIRNGAGTGESNILFNTHNGSSSADRWQLSKDGHLLPQANNTYDIGEASYRVRNIYTNDLHLSNNGSSNDMDGTWGDWTIQEGESDLFLKNNRSGKKYKFNLTEVS